MKLLQLPKNGSRVRTLSKIIKLFNCFGGAIVVGGVPELDSRLIVTLVTQGNTVFYEPDVHHKHFDENVVVKEISDGTKVAQTKARGVPLFTFVRN